MTLSSGESLGVPPLALPFSPGALFLSLSGLCEKETAALRAGTPNPSPR